MTMTQELVRNADSLLCSRLTGLKAVLVQVPTVILLHIQVCEASLRLVIYCFLPVFHFRSPPQVLWPWPS